MSKTLNKKVLSVIWGILFTIGAVVAGMGAIICLAGILSIAEDGFGIGVGVTALGFCILAAGIALIFVAKKRFETKSATKSETLSIQGSQNPNPQTSNSVAEQTPLRNKTQGQQPQLENLLVRSDDSLAALKDLVLHGQSAATPLLLTMLTRVGITSWTDAPKLYISRLQRSSRWWLQINPDEFDPTIYDKLLAVEAALNVASDADLIHNTALSDDQLIRAVLNNTAQLTTQTYPLTQKLLMGDEYGEWAYRLRFSDYAETAQVAFRLSFDIVANVNEGVVDVRAELPRPAACCAFANTIQEQIEIARSYSVRLAALLARFAFAAGDTIHQAQVRLLERSDTSSRIILTLNRNELDAFLTTLDSLVLDAQALIAHPHIQASLDEAGWFVPIKQAHLINAYVLDPPYRHNPPELSHASCAPELYETTGARYVSDLGINENAGRVSAWNTINANLGSSTKDAVAKLVELRNSTQDVTILEACNRTSKALVEGTIDVSEKQALAQLFAFGGNLEHAVDKAQRAIEDPDNNNPIEALEELESALAPITNMGMYLDDNETVYRYFNSASDRIAFNLDIDDHTRTVRLVSDYYYRAHSLAARLLSLVGRDDEALTHIDELMRIAPATTDAILIKVRWLEDHAQIFEAADLLMKAIVAAPTAHDMAVCHYRLAYMEWKLGRSDLAVACYERAISLAQQVSSQAVEELNDLLEADSSLSRHNNDDEVLAVLEAAGIPYGPIGKLRERIAKAAKTTADANLFSTSKQLTASLIDLGRDDALVDTYKSLSIELRSVSPTGYELR